MYNLRKFHELFQDDESWGMAELDDNSIMIIGSDEKSISKIYILLDIRSDDPKVGLTINQDTTDEEIMVIRDQANPNTERNDGVFNCDEERWNKVISTIALFQLRD